MVNGLNRTQIWVHRNTFVNPSSLKPQVYLPNTIPSIRESYKAFQLPGVHAIEIDLLTTSDGSPVVFNPFSPYDLGCDVNGRKRNIFEISDSEVKSFVPNIHREQAFLSKRYGDIVIPSDVDNSIPFLGEIDRPIGIEKLDLDVIKLDDPDYMKNCPAGVREAALRNIAEWIKTNRLQNNVVITGRPDALDDLRKLLGENVKMCLALSRDSSLIDKEIKTCSEKEIGIQYASPNTVQVLENLGMIEQFSRRNVDLIPAELREGKETELDAIRRLIESGIPGVKTYFPREVSEIDSKEL